MKQQISPDEAIDRVLSGLRHAAAPEGMERRIVHAATHRAGERSRWPGIGFFERLVLQPSTVVALGVILSLTISIALHRKSHARHDVAVEPAHPSSPPPALSANYVHVLTPDRPGRANVAPHRQSTASQAQQEPLSADDALALSEMNAPSQPAPPLPLTHQEKLLAEAVHQAGPEELSSLRSEIRAQQMEVSKAEFRDFFEPPPAKDNE